MTIGQDYRDRDDVEVEVLDALVDRRDDGMTVFELRTHVGVDIDEIEAALSRLDEDGLITVEKEAERTVILPDERVIPDPEGDDDHDRSLVEEIRDRLPF